MVLKLICMAGSLRKDSFNKKLARLAAGIASNTGVEVTFIDLKDYDLPNYDGDLEESAFPKAALELQKVLKDHDGYIIASPEYNSSISGALKNAIDWTSRDGKGGGDLSAFNDKSALLLAASPGGLGGLRGLVTLRSILSNIGVTCHPEQLAVPSAMNAFADAGLRDAAMQERLTALVQKFCTFAAKLSD